MVVCKIFRGIRVFRKHNTIHAAAWAEGGCGGDFLSERSLFKEEVPSSIVCHPDALTNFSNA